MFVTCQTSEIHSEAAFAEIGPLVLAILIFVHLQEIHGMLTMTLDNMLLSF
jgi:hypothetical protein